MPNTIVSSLQVVLGILGTSLFYTIRNFKFAKRLKYKHQKGQGKLCYFDASTIRAGEFEVNFSPLKEPYKFIE